MQANILQEESEKRNRWKRSSSSASTGKKDRPKSTAVSVFPSEKINELLLCPICQDTVKDPRVLPCMHTFCLVCLERLHAPDFSMVCPCCRKLYTYSKPLSNAVPIDLKANELLSAKPIELSSYIKCKCCRSKPSIAKCTHCSTYVCVECIQRHEREVKDQTLKIAGEIREYVDDVEDVHNQVIVAVHTNWTDIQTSVAEQIRRLHERLAQCQESLLQTIADHKEADIASITAAYRETELKFVKAKKFLDSCDIFEVSNDRKAGMRDALDALGEGQGHLRYITSIRKNMDVEKLVRRVPRLHLKPVDCDRLIVEHLIGEISYVDNLQSPPLPPVSPRRIQQQQHQQQLDECDSLSGDEQSPSQHRSNTEPRSNPASVDNAANYPPAHGSVSATAIQRSRSLNPFSCLSRKMINSSRKRTY